MNLQHILNVTVSAVYKSPPTANLAAVVEKLVQHNCGSLVVCSGDEMIGIISERDILRACNAKSNVLEELRVEQFMTADVHTGCPEDTVENIMGLMTEKRIRHLRG